MDLQETFPIGFIGAAQSEGEPAVIYISSDEKYHMDCVSSGSVSDLVSSSDEEAEEIQIIARWPAGTTDSQKRCPTPRPNRPPFPTFSQRYFNHGNGNDPLVFDDRQGEEQSPH